MSSKKNTVPDIDHQRQQTLNLIERWIIQEEERAIKLKSDKSPIEVIEQNSPCFGKPTVHRKTAIKNKNET